MRIQLEKFGTTLVSRQQGKEAYAAFLPTLKSISENDTVEVDFSGVITFSPSWGDEFLSPLLVKYKNRLKLVSISNNPSVLLTVTLLEKIHDTKFIQEN
jgi:hypothetical protein